MPIRARILRQLRNGIINLSCLEEEDEKGEVDPEPEDDQWSTASVGRDTLSKRIDAETGGPRESNPTASESRKGVKRKQVTCWKLKFNIVGNR